MKLSLQTNFFYQRENFWSKYENRMAEFILKVEEITFLRKSASIISECCKIVFGGDRVEITLPMFQSWQIQNYKKVNFQSE